MGDPISQGPRLGPDHSSHVERVVPGANGNAAARQINSPIASFRLKGISSWIAVGAGALAPTVSPSKHGASAPEEMVLVSSSCFAACFTAMRGLRVNAINSRKPPTPYQPAIPCVKLLIVISPGVAELADAADSKSAGDHSPCGFDSLLRDQYSLNVLAAISQVGNSV